MNPYKKFICKLNLLLTLWVLWVIVYIFLIVTK